MRHLQRLLVLLLLAGPLQPRADGDEDKAPGTFQLSEALRMALRENFGLRDTILAREIARTQVDSAEAGFDPELTLGADYQSRRSAQASSRLDGALQPESSDTGFSARAAKNLTLGTELSIFGTTDRSVTNSDNALLNPDVGSEIGAQLRQPVLQGAGTAANLAPIRQAEAGLRASDAQLRAEVGNLLAGVENAYWRLAASILRVDIQRASLEVNKVLLDKVTREQALGAATRIDILEAEAALIERQETLLRAEQEAANNWDRLLVILGASPAAYRTIPAGIEPLPADFAPPPSTGESMARALETDPDLESAREGILQRELGLVTARNNRLPSLDMVLTGAYQGRDDDYSASFGRTFDRDGYRWSAGVELSFPWGFQAEKARLAEARANLRRAEISRDETESILIRNLLIARREINDGRAALESARASIRLRVELLKAEEQRRESGASDLSDVLEAQSNLDSVRLREIEARLALAVAEAELARIEGRIFERHGYPWEKLRANLIRPPHRNDS